MQERIITLTLSPTLDVATSVDVVTAGPKLRCDVPRFEPGGGGINVARVARRLGADATAVAPLGGQGGLQVVDALAGEGVDVRAVEVDQPVRQNLSVFEESTGAQYRFVMPAQQLSEDDTQRCFDAVLALCDDAACVVVSGSIAIPSVHERLAEIVALVSPIPVLIDTSASALDAALQSGAALVKPSARELTDIVGHALDTERQVADAALETLESSTVEAILVSVGAGGAFLARHDEPLVRFRAPTVRVKSAIGAGDSLVAGVAVGLAAGQDQLDAVRLGIASGTATVLTEGTQLCDRAAVDELLALVAVDGRG